MNSGMMRQHKLILGIAALVMVAVLLIFTVGTQVNYADGDPTGRMANGDSVIRTGGDSEDPDHQGTKVGVGVEV
jgi:hypothetical protein